MELGRLEGGPEYQSPTHEILEYGVRPLTRASWPLPEARIPRLVRKPALLVGAVAGDEAEARAEEAEALATSELELELGIVFPVDGVVDPAMDETAEDAAATSRLEGDGEARVSDSGVEELEAASANATLEAGGCAAAGDTEAAGEIADGGAILLGAALTVIVVVGL